MLIFFVFVRFAGRLRADSFDFAQDFTLQQAQGSLCWHTPVHWLNFGRAELIFLLCFPGLKPGLSCVVPLGGTDVTEEWAESRGQAEIPTRPKQAGWGT